MSTHCTTSSESIDSASRWTTSNGTRRGSCKSSGSPIDMSIYRKTTLMDSAFLLLNMIYQPDLFDMGFSCEELVTHFTLSAFDQGSIAHQKSAG